jgi:lambda repressor-like predicted transcriptional regulator
MAKQTPSQITCEIIQAALSSSGMGVAELARRVQVHVNTVRNDLHDPDRIPQNRLWLYFTVLGVPIEDALEKIAKEFAFSLVRR